MTIQKFQELYVIYNMELPEIDKSVKLVQVYKGLSEDEVDALPLHQFNKYCREIGKAFEMRESKPVTKIKVNGNHYMLNLDISKMSAGRYVEAVTFSQDLVPNLHKIMATIVQPTTWWGRVLPYDSHKHEAYADDMLHADFDAAYTAAVFFYQLFKGSMKSLNTYFMTEAMKAGADKITVMHTLKDLTDILDGFILQNQLPKWSDAN